MTALKFIYTSITQVVKTQHGQATHRTQVQLILTGFFWCANNNAYNQWSSSTSTPNVIFKANKNTPTSHNPLAMSSSTSGCHVVQCQFVLNKNHDIRTKLCAPHVSLPEPVNLLTGGESTDSNRSRSIPINWPCSSVVHQKPPNRPDYGYPFWSHSTDKQM